MSIRIGIMGYGNLGRGVECAVQHAPDMELCAVFTRREPGMIRLHDARVPVLPAAQLADWSDQLDVLILCGGSATDLPEMTPALAQRFHVVDSFDTHANIPAHFAAVDAAAAQSGHTALISAGWDPGLFSLARLLGQSVLPDGSDYTFWGRGVSQGHSDAIRRIPGVLDARQYTVPVPEALEAVRAGECPELTARQKHRRECYVVAAEGADREEITRAIVTMPNYFADYDTTVSFLTAEELARDHAGLPHGGSVLRTGRTGWEKEEKQTVEFRLELQSNPGFTGSVLAACARAVHAMAQRGEHGCKTIFDLRPADLSPLSREELLAHVL